MPTQKDLKRTVRTRIRKAGQSYTAARSKIVGKHATPPAEYAKLAGMSDQAVESKTGRSWQRWVQELDSVDAARMPHREIARHLQSGYEISGWWAQTVTVAYERIRGLRDVGQRRSGKFDANKSKTFPVPISRLYRAFSAKRRRERWLPGVDLKIRTSTVDRSMRITWPDDTSVHAHFTAKGPRKSAVAIQHSGLASKKDATERKEYWAARLECLGELL